MFGKTLITYTVSETEAVKEIAGSELDLALASIIQVKGLRNPHKQDEVTYRIRLRNANPADYFSEESTQSVQAVDGNTILLTVRRIEPPARAGVARRADPRYLKATPFLQANDYEVTRLARQASAGISDSSRQAQNMEKTVFEKVRAKNFSSAMASAAEVAKSREGDCTEHAMLLAAMLRAGKLPSRICAGFVYTESLNGFAGHMWTEVWLRDRWYPLDATLGQGGIGPGHLKISDSAVDENAPAPIVSFLPMLELMGQMTIEVERQR
jgi:transglutaminase-like putative cysteine protease